MIKNLSFKNTFLIFIILFVYSNTICSQITISLNSGSRSISPNLFGYNGRSTEGPEWTNTDFITLVEQ